MKIYDLESIKKRKLIFLDRLKKIAILLFGIYILTYLFQHYEDYTPSSISRSVTYMALAHQSINNEDEFLIETNANSKSSTFLKSVINLDDSYARIFGLNGEIYDEINLDFKNAKIDYGKNNFIFYDIGGYEVVVANSLGETHRQKEDYRIIDGFIDINDNYGLIVDEAQYTSSVKVYDNMNMNIFNWSTSKYNLLSASLSGDRLATIGIGQDGLDFISMVRVFDIKSGETIFETEISEDFPIDIRFIDEKVIVILENGYAIYNETGDLILKENDIALKAYNVKDAHNIIYLENNFDNSYILNILNSDLEIISTVFDGTPEKIYTSNRHIYIYSENSLHKFDLKLNKIDEIFIGAGVLDVLVFDDDEIYAIYSNKLERV